MQGNQMLKNQPAESQSKVFATLSDLLPPSITTTVIDSADTVFVDNLLNHLPPTLLLLNQEIDNVYSVDPIIETAKAGPETLSLDQKKDILKKVLRSPQFSQSLGILTGALRDGGLPSISDALRISVENGGFMKRGGVPLGGGNAVEAFLNGIKAAVQKRGDDEQTKMDTD